MSTRCQTKVIEDEKENKYNENITMYHHCDGMPDSMIPLFYKAYLYGVTPFIPDWRVNQENPETIDMAWQAFRGGYAASFLCHIDPRGFQPENSHELHGDIEWYYKLYVQGKAVKGQKNKQQWEVEIYKATTRREGAPTLKKVLKKTPLCELLNEDGEFKVEILSALTEK
jgi:hypothetical protein